jgi:hypothetical protein
VVLGSLDCNRILFARGGAQSFQDLRIEIIEP